MGLVVWHCQTPLAPPSDSPFRLRCAPLDQGGSAPWTLGRKGFALSASPLPRCAWTGGVAPWIPVSMWGVGGGDVRFKQAVVLSNAYRAGLQR